MSRTSSPTARTYPVTRVMRSNRHHDGDPIVVPGLRCTLPEIQACVNDAPLTIQVWCETCGESVADCPVLRGKLHNLPERWSYRWDAQD